MSLSSNKQHLDPSQIKDPFGLIEIGNDLENSNDLWAAAYHFLQASTVLRAKSDRGDINAAKSDKERKVAALFADQSVIYLHKARKTLIDAMEKERDRDMKHASEIPTRVEAVSLLLGNCDEKMDYNMKTDQMFKPYMESMKELEVLNRRELFQKLFVSMVEKRNEDGEKNPETEDEVKKEKALLSLEERLALLETSLPAQHSTKPKSDNERMLDLQKGLSGLGVFCQSADEIYKQKELSEEDQVEEVINMATDEVRLDVQRNGRGDIHDVQELLKKSSIRIDLDSSYDDESYRSNSSDISNNNGNDQEMNFWKNLEIEEEKPAVTKLEEMKQYLKTAQQLLLQASLCIEDLEENGVNFENDEFRPSPTCPEPTKNRANDGNFEKSTITENTTRSCRCENLGPMDNTEESENPKNGADNDEGSDTRSSNDPPIQSQDAIISDDTGTPVTTARCGDNQEQKEAESSAAIMGLDGLEEAHDLVGKVISMWASKKQIVKSDFC